MWDVELCAIDASNQTQFAKIPKIQQYTAPAVDRRKRNTTERERATERKFAFNLFFHIAGCAQKMICCWDINAFGVGN